MAIYHLSVKTISRKSGRSATAAIAYRAAAKIPDRRIGLVHDYTRKQGVEHTEIVTPEGVPEWAQDRAELWNQAEQVEVRKNATVAREIEVSLPHELTAAQRRDLAVGFAQMIAARHEVAVDVAIHAPHGHGDERNHHAHLLFSTRRLTPEGFGEKTREWDNRQPAKGMTGKATVEHWREAWAWHVNQALERAGVQARVDHRSLEAQGIERLPAVHLGVHAAAMERRGVHTSRGDQARGIEAYNAQVVALGRIRGEVLQATPTRKAQETPEKGKAILLTPTAGKGPKKPVEARSAPGATLPTPTAGKGPKKPVEARSAPGATLPTPTAGKGPRRPPEAARDAQAPDLPLLPAGPSQTAPGPPGGPRKASAGSAYDRIIALAERNARKQARKAQEAPEKGKATLATPAAGKGPQRPPEAARGVQAPDLSLSPASPSQTQTAPGPPGGPQRQEWPAAEVAKVVRRHIQDLEQEAAKQAKTLERTVEIAGMTPEQVRTQARAQVGGQWLEAAQQTHAQAMEQITKLRYLFEIYDARWSQAGLGQRWNPWSSLNREGQDLERARKAALVEEAKARKELAAVDVWLEQPAQRQAIKVRYGELVGMVRQLREELPAQRHAIEAKRTAAALGREREKDLWTLGGRLVAVDRQRGEDGQEKLTVDWDEVKRQAEQVRQQLREQWERRRDRDRGGPER